MLAEEAHTVICSHSVTLLLCFADPSGACLTLVLCHVAATSHAMQAWHGASAGAHTLLHHAKAGGAATDDILRCTGRLPAADHAVGPGLGARVAAVRMALQLEQQLAQVIHNTLVAPGAIAPAALFVEVRGPPATSMPCSRCCWIPRLVECLTSCTPEALLLVLHMRRSSCSTAAFNVRSPMRSVRCAQALISSSCFESAVAWKDRFQQ